MPTAPLLKAGLELKGINGPRMRMNFIVENNDLTAGNY
jgi:hypothetical protein